MEECRILLGTIKRIVDFVCLLALKIVKITKSTLMILIFDFQNLVYLLNIYPYKMRQSQQTFAENKKFYETNM
jgi:hypothetical protein